MTTGVKKIWTPDAPCDHGVTFDEAAAAWLPAAEVQRRWPRRWFTYERPCVCGFVGIAYVSQAHFLSGDW